MGKKKSKTQKQKKKNRQKQNRQLVSVINTKQEINDQKLKTETQVAEESETIYNVKKDKVKLKPINQVKKKSSPKKKKNKNSKKTILKLKKLFLEIFNKGKKKFKGFTSKTKKKKDKKIVNKEKVDVKKGKKLAKKSEPELPKLAKGKKIVLPELFFKLKGNIHVFFNALLIILFLFLLIGLIRTSCFKKGTIVYIGVLVFFLIVVAISYNKYLSGKIFSSVIAIVLFLAIYRLQYTYDFIRSLNTYKYEFRTYYVVTFDNNMNKSIYNFNNKPIGLMSNNSTNVTRMLNTKLDQVEYIYFDDVNELFNSFYKQNFKALIVNENQYRYLVNNEVNTGKAVKILYEFDVNALK